MYHNYEKGDVVLVSYDGGKTFVQYRHVGDRGDAAYVKELVDNPTRGREIFKITGVDGTPKHP